MTNWVAFLKSLYSIEGLTALIQAGGIPVLSLIIFSETGLLIGLFLPGDSLLVTAGVVASQKTANGSHVLEIGMLNIALILAAIIGNQVGYWLGSKTGPAIFSRSDSRFFKKKYAIEAHEFYLKYGGRAIMLACFAPIFRTFVPFVAGVAEMPYRRFAIFNVIGAALWVTLMVWCGYLAGPYVGKKIHYFILFIIFVSLLPIMIGALKRYLKSRKGLTDDTIVRNY